MDIGGVIGDANGEASSTAATPAPSAAYEYFSTADPRLSGATVKEVLRLFDAWNTALASGDPAQVADLYASNGVLLPTVSNSVRSTRDGLIDYFTAFLKLQPQGRIDEYGIRMEAVDRDGVPTVISNSGIYTFDFGVDGRRVQARYTFVYTRADGAGWKILSHHSSQLPTQLAPTPFKGQKYLSGSTSDDQLTKEEEAGVLRAFDKWNRALAANPDAVVDCYAADAVLLPTVADNLRTTRSERRDYFVDFLKKSPQGTLDEYHIRLIGRDALGLPSAVSNQGIYTFVMGQSGERVQARYTFNYARDGESWLIKKHHSSAMPETATAAAAA